MFDYILPPGRIAQRPNSGARHDSKLLWASSGFIRDSKFSELPEILKPSDLLIFNNSKVIPTRFFFMLNEKEVEVLLLRQISAKTWEALARPMKKLISGLEFDLSPLIKAKVIGRSEDLTRIILELSSQGELIEAIKETGLMPIPPYIRDGKSDAKDYEQYQTEFAEHEGSVAAPTAGLHFSKQLLAALQDIGIEVDFVTLHVSQWSFSQVAQDSKAVSEEYYQVSKQTWDKIKEAKKNSRRVIAVGTTSVRALESRALLQNDDLVSGFQASSLFIKPGFEFKVIDSMITNFHQPNSTHLMLVSAFLGEQKVKEVYYHALAGDYRFLSYGDGCFLEKL